MGMTVQNLQNYKMLSDMIPELDELVQTGIVMPTTALSSGGLNSKKISVCVV